MARLCTLMSFSLSFVSNNWEVTSTRPTTYFVKGTGPFGTVFFSLRTPLPILYTLRSARLQQPSDKIRSCASKIKLVLCKDE